MRTVSVTPDIYRLLYRCGIPSNLSGCDYLATAVAIILKNPDARYGVCRGLYPKLGAIFGTSACCAERRMRYAVTVGFNRSFDLNKEIFGNSLNYNTGAPTVTHFITAIANYLRPLHHL